MKYIQFLPLVILLFGCKKNSNENLIYDGQSFQIYKNKVVQGPYEAHIKSPEHIVSNYQTAAASEYSRIIDFKISINEKDCELPAYKNHQLVIEGDQSPIITFGDLGQAPTIDNTKRYLPINYKYTFNIDVSPVLDQFEKSGYFTARDGSKISKNEFTGFYLAGSGYPLTWDFSNLEEKGLKLTPTNNKNIYSITLTLNPLDTTSAGKNEWKLTRDIAAKPHFKSDIPLIDALYNMSVEEALINIEPDSTFRTGAKWGGVWTRDVSYSIYLAFAYHQPDIAINSLKRKVKRGRIIQDTGSGGAWPVSSDRVVWAMAANEIYKFTGDKEWLAYAYEVIKNSIEDDRYVLYDPETGLYKGESSFLDWREQTYPKWMQNADIYNSENLGTNINHYVAIKTCAEMADELGYDSKEYKKQMSDLQSSININLWQADKGYYAQYLYGRDYLTKSPRFEALGEALAVIWDIADQDQATSIYSKSPLTTFGTTCIYPQIPGIPPYHNNAVWPFVQAYWNLGAAKVKNEKALTHGLAAIYRAGALFTTNYENFVAQNGDYYGTEINSNRMLWSMAGNIAMVHRVFMGMQFESDGVSFAPVVPEPFKGVKELTNFKYRNATLNIKVSGYGANIVSFKINGNETNSFKIDSDATGVLNIEITLDNTTFDNDGINLVNNAFSPSTPVTELNSDTLKWNNEKGVSNYNLYKNGQFLTSTTNLYSILQEEGEYKIEAVGANNTSSFTSEPITYKQKINVSIDFNETDSYQNNNAIKNYSGNGFIEVSRDRNQEITKNVTVEEDGNYFLMVRYANGNGAWNTDNSCALRSLFINDQFAGTLVMPQRGTNEWSNWGNSNSVKVKLKKGQNLISIAFMPWNHNMNFEKNTALIDILQISKE